MFNGFEKYLIFFFEYFRKHLLIFYIFHESMINFYFELRKFFLE